MYSCYFSFSDVFLPPPPKKKDGVQGYNIAATCRNEVVYMYLSNIDAPIKLCYLLAASERGVLSFASSHSITFIRCLLRIANPIASLPTPFWSSNAFTYQVKKENTR